MTEFTKLADSILESNRDGNIDNKKIELMIKLNGDLHREANNAVTLFQQNSEQKIDNMLTVEQIIALVALLFSVLLTFIVKRQVRNVDSEIESLISSVIEGDLSARGATTSVVADFKGVILKINDLIETFTIPIKTSISYLESVARGEKVNQITEQYRGDFNKFKESINLLIDSSQNISNIASEISNGNLSVEIVERCEEDQIMQSLKVMRDDLKVMIGSIKENIKVQSISADELSEITDHLLEGAENTSEQTESVAGAAEELTTNMFTIASATEEVNVNIASISDNSNNMTNSMDNLSVSVEEMSESIKNVAVSAKEASSESVLATGRSKDAIVVMKKLEDAANQITNVTNVIKKIADKTNLLALNATIEAASAGDAGKGFAVVANEIKELARQSAKSADSIAMEIGGIQESSTDATTSINEISELITSVNKKIEKIDKQVNEQASVSVEISKNIVENSTGLKNIARALDEMSEGLNDTSKNIGEGSKASNSISEDFLAVASISRETKASTQKVKEISETLSSLTSKLIKVIEKFN